jgi:hypothetical protein
MWVVLWSWELWIDVLNVFVGVLSIDHEVEKWLHVAISNCLEVAVDDVPGVEHDWGVGWRQPFLIFFRQVDGFMDGHDELSFVLNDSLVLLGLGDGVPVILEGIHLVGLDKSSDLGSEGNHLWNLVTSIVLHLSELVVLLVEVDPGIIVDSDGTLVVWVLTSNFFLHGFLENVVGLHDSVDLSHVFVVELLDLRRWSLLLHGLDEGDDGMELWSISESVSLSLELFWVLGGHHLIVVLHGLLLECSLFIEEWLNLILSDVDLEHFSSLLEIVHWGGGDDGGESGELVHFV